MSQPLFLLHLFLLFSAPFIGFSQTINSQLIPFEVNKTYPYISISTKQLSEAETLIDLNTRYKAAWVNTYLSVVITTIHQGKVITSKGTSEQLTVEQKEQLNLADTGTNINIKVDYIPENNLTEKEPRTFDFIVAVEPDQDAYFYGGTTNLNQYLQEKAIRKIPNSSITGYQMAAVKFTINKLGEVVQPSLFESSKDEQIDELLLETIRTMPCWHPASFTDGTETDQQFVLIVGSMENCMIPILNIRKW